MVICFNLCLRKIFDLLLLLTKNREKNLKNYDDLFQSAFLAKYFVRLHYKKKLFFSGLYFWP